MSDTNKIGLLAATIIGINAMIGAGIFAMPAKLAFLVGPASALSYAVSAVLVLFIVFALGRLAVLHPGDAWGYRYPALWGGHLVGMIASIGYVAGVTIAMGFLTQQLGVWVSSWVPYDPVTIGVSLLVLIVGLVVAGAEVSAVGQYIIAACVVVPMVVASVTCWLHADKNLLLPFAPYGYGAVVTSLPVILFSLLGFESISSLYRTVADPKRNVPRAALYSVAIVALLFAFFIVGALGAIDKSFFAGGVNQAFAEALVAAIPSCGWLRVLISVGAFFAIFGTLHSMTWSVAELFFDTLSKGRGCLVKWLFDSRLLTRHTAVYFIGAGTAISAFFLKADIIMALTGITIVAAYLLSVMALLFERATWQSLKEASIAVGATLSSGWLFWLGFKSVMSLI